MRELRSILLAGGAGFIGSTLARHLLAVDSLERLVVLDKLTSAGKRGNLIGPDRDPRFEFVEGDIADRTLVAHLLSDNRITGVFNLAVETHLDRSPGSPADFLATNVTGTANLLEECRPAGVPLLQCSTGEVHGPIAAPGRLTETSPLNPTTPYAASKAAADLLCQAATKTHGQDTVITRCTNNYGPRQHREKLIPTFIAAALRDEPLLLAGDGMAIRDWMHVDDHCRGLLAAFSRGSAGGTFYFGGRCERTNLGIARDILKALGKPESLIDFVPDRPGHDQRCAVDVTRSLHYFSWQPEKKFQDAFPAVVRELAADLNPGSGG